MHTETVIIDHTLLTAFYEKFIALQAPLPKDKHLVVPEESIHFFNMVGVGQLGMEAIVAAGMAAAGSSHDFLRTLGDLGMSTKEWTVFLKKAEESLAFLNANPANPDYWQRLVDLAMAIRYGAPLAVLWGNQRWPEIIALANANAERLTALEHFGPIPPGLPTPEHYWDAAGQVRKKRGLTGQPVFLDTRDEAWHQNNCPHAEENWHRHSLRKKGIVSRNCGRGNGRPSGLHPRGGRSKERYCHRNTRVEICVGSGFSGWLEAAWRRLLFRMGSRKVYCTQLSAPLMASVTSPIENANPKGNATVWHSSPPPSNINLSNTPHKFHVSRECVEQIGDQCDCWLRISAE